MKVTPKKNSRYLSQDKSYDVVNTDTGGNQYVIADDGRLRPYSPTTFS
jgi:hypothetical protein